MPEKEPLFYIEEIFDYVSQRPQKFALNFWEDPRYFKLHRHNFVEFMYVVKGEGTEHINSISYSLKPGTFSIVMPYQIHRIDYSEQTPLSIYVVAISFEELLAPSSIFYKIGKLLLSYDENVLPYYYFEGKEKEVMDRLFKEAWIYYNQQDVWAEIILKAKILEIVAYFDRCRNLVCEKSFQRPASNSVINRTQEESIPVPFDYWQLVYYVHKNYNQNIDLKTLSKEFHLSPSYISQLFKKLVGSNFHNFLNEVRLQHACSLLLSTDKPVTDIALEVGFDSYSTFARVFHKHKGMSAQEFRKRGGHNS
ncbi:transcriptional regulator, AraC family [Caldicellulosiruptor kronotskyensis 2002]|uniref:Transcriptional regulator, AraC family n=1 Tax=Caldicellulosiruptor kronotskyensis (strain DSM 18902 / VKM B-2412 / 2002) TaxID=632348 RepID=E4SHQ8_CALK2|nr:AraC family transcriptional regulator [Caldicellulosiruptor kronotskyensis]ADQ47283.1 transcriptional regulator, AraC family [Caldicellulosiruptor kronotskyensis 2002]